MTKLHRKDVPTPAPGDRWLRAKGALAEAGTAEAKTKTAFTTLSASSLGIELGVSVVIGILFGMWLDSKAGTSPWLMVLFLVLGLVAGFRSVLRAAKRADRDGEGGHG